DRVPFDHIIIMANSNTYGGGAIYNFYAISAVLDMSEWILPHELGHSIGGLADEYVEATADTSFDEMYPRNVEPIEPNITTLVAFDKKWKAMIPDGTPIPTQPVEGLKKNECGPLGVYEGAGYVPQGVFRPVTSCMMRDYHPFCPVCSKRLNEVFDSYCK
ncbi:MAG: M64 family metallopeptidase, partial [Bacteroidales bacterium]|nr:M64 family metallopeptidase [Bacteroidales bacterium]